MSKVSPNQMIVVRQKMQAIVPHLREVATKVLTPEKITKIVCSACSRNPLLLQAFHDTPDSILRCAFAATQLGLDPDSPLGHCYMVPFRNGRRQGAYEAQFILGARGMVELAMRSGKVRMVFADVFYSSDQFFHRQGYERFLEHIPAMGDRGEMLGAYAIAELDSGIKMHEVMSRSQVDEIRKQSKARDSGPWVTHYDEMAKKTVIKRLCKQLPMCPELSDAIDVEHSHERGVASSIDIDIPALTTMSDSAEEMQPTEAPVDAKDAEILERLKK